MTTNRKQTYIFFWPYTIRLHNVASMLASYADGGPALKLHWVDAVISLEMTDWIGWANAGLMLGQRHNRCSDIKTALAQCLRFSGRKIYIIRFTLNSSTRIIEFRRFLSQFSTNFHEKIYTPYFQFMSWLTWEFLCIYCMSNGLTS